MDSWTTSHTCWEARSTFSWSWTLGWHHGVVCFSYFFFKKLSLVSRCYRKIALWPEGLKKLQRSHYKEYSVLWITFNSNWWVHKNHLETRSWLPYVITLCLYFYPHSHNTLWGDIVNMRTLGSRSVGPWNSHDFYSSTLGFSENFKIAQAGARAGDRCPVPVRSAGTPCHTISGVSLSTCSFPAAVMRCGQEAGSRSRRVLWFSPETVSERERNYSSRFFSRLPLFYRALI